MQIPAAPAVRAYQRTTVARGLHNPRGLVRDGDGVVLAEAGTGDAKQPLTGRLLRLADRDGDRAYLEPDERRVLLDQQLSVNILNRLAMNRDEVFGLADVARGDGMTLVSAVDIMRGSTLYRVDGDGRVSPWGTTPGNANSLAFDPRRKRWYAVQSFENTVVEVGPQGRTRTVARLPPLERGQDAVPAAIVHEPATGALLVALFSGQIGGDTGGSGVDFVKGAGQIVRLDPDSGKTTVVVAGLTTPVDLAVGADGAIYVLEFCSSFLDPLKTAPSPDGAPSHGGFARYSGRLLRVDLGRREAVVLAQEIDLPTNVELEPGGSLLVSIGQGTPGRLIPGPRGPEPLEGRVERFSPQ